MTWQINWSEEACKQLKKLDKSLKKAVTKYLRERVEAAVNPRDFGKALKYSNGQLWRYRVADIRIICHIEDDALTILVLRVGHRKSVYRDKVDVLLH
ncbi:MAG: translation repressor RelE [marine bacterium B5-7]|nr:MAG: translation repressor RelE [marine bacterium B5-7]